ncbi:HlyD family secretion protein [Akkermansiaceae bacterium]|nr:HlyD family secretion protein [Akkermansiaceae bacterium]
MADIYKNQIRIPENLPEILTPFNNNQAVIIEKDVYGAQGVRDNLDTDFSELNKPKTKNLNGFFKDYEELFYDIPEEGKEKSHRYILDTSGEYLNMFEEKDNRIEQLENQITDLEEEIEELRNPEEHPFYPNGSVLSKNKGGSYFFMERGKKRQIVGGRPGQVWKTLKVALGFKESDDDYEMGIVKPTPSDVIAQIKSGPMLDIEDIGGGLQQSPKAIAVKLDPTDYKANPDRYDNLEDYSRALEKEIIEAWDLERNMENLYYKYQNDSDNAYTQAERDEAKIEKQVAAIELEKARRKLAAYKMIYQNIKSNQTTTIEGITEMYETFTKDNFEAISDSAINQFRGWEVGKGSLEDVVGNFYNDKGRGTQYT